MVQNLIKADSGCFVCGRENPIGLKAEFRIDSDRNRATANITIGDNFQGWQGVVHGGIIATLLDEAAIYASRTLSAEAVTAGITVKYKSPVPTGSMLIIEAEVISVRRRIAIVNASLIVDSSIMAEAEVKVMLLKKQTV